MPAINGLEGAGMIAFHHSVFGADGDAVCTLGFTTENDDGQEVADKLSGAWSTTLFMEMHQATNYNGTSGVQFINGQLESWISTVGSTAEPSTAGNMLPPNCAVLIRKTSGLAGKKHRGRMYLPAIGANRVTGTPDFSNLSSTALTAFQAAADAFYNKIIDTSEGGQIIPVILHPTTPTTATVVTALSVQVRLATQRGRLR